MNYKKITLDTERKSFESIVAMQGDNKSRYIEATIVNRSIPVDLTGCTVKFSAIKPDITDIFNDTVISDAKGGKAQIELTNQTLAVPGVIQATLVILKEDMQLSVLPFFITVIENPYNSNAIESKSEYKALNNALTIVEGYAKELQDASVNLEEKYTTRLNNFDSQLDKKINKTDKIKGSQLDTSSDSAKLGINNLNEEAIQLLSRPLQMRMGNADFQIGYDNDGSIKTENNKVVCNTNLLNVEKDRAIQIKTSFRYRVIIAFYKDNTFVRRTDFYEPGNERFDLVGNDFNQIRLSFQKYPNEDDAIDLHTDVIEVYVGYSTMIAEIKDNSITEEKYADGSINNKKIQEPVTRIIPWVPFKITTKNETSVSIRFEWNTVLTFSNSKFVRIDEYVDVTLSDGELVYLTFDTNNSGTVNSENFIVESTITYQPRSDKHPLVFNYGNKLYSDIPIYHNYISSYTDGTNPLGNTNNVITVGKSGAMFDTINKAVDYARPLSNVNNQFTIVVYPGTYKEVVNLLGTAYISIVGVNKVTCILRDDSGQYINAPLRVQGNCFIYNMTIISSHDDDPSADIESLRSYAVHADDPGEGTTEFNNCIMISYQSAAFGCGMHTNQTVKLINCELYSYCPAESTVKDLGAIFLHDGQDATNQNVIIKNCTLKSLHGKSMYLNGHYGTEVKVSFYNNMFWCEETGKDSIRLDPPNTGISNNIKLNPDSYGNNVDILNG